ncbi:protein-S-isoprenylcysteine carboxyl O-methyltransferase NDAI_0A04160 [Naumovozyma dairenensis CBS 421]|uniref:Protein-S-isoprenylcysteine O-methyltransferase n=1 Tax=Naumovozyma dairenensis (strain ATCC 10597 / BCRC 20456 / CBS 421 / NBRC 0211 / NRRL Y-12639) TaxID=1071378 RepID=G0W435_NAUDC|nr:hypothetical protein NDAI_0A04160 [Naumovozyma dairenensis CBS 421]CCD22573.1 hypothetical protein NDAI_0A04160 [Naumovozyma dairenensis CBS 421]
MSSNLRNRTDKQNTKTREESEDLPSIINGKPYPDITRNPLHEVTLTSLFLGTLMGLSIGLLPVLTFKSFNIYIFSFALFHFLEFYVTAKYNPGKVHSDSFILKNGISYTLAHALGVFECLIESYFFQDLKSTSNKTFQKYLSIIGLFLVIMGQSIRFISMKTAGKSFSHLLKTEKEDDHTLVTDGIYSVFRHPSYLGFFWWAVGTQILLLNPISTCIFVYVLWNFFSKRIKIEEKYLIEFFGEDYVNYKKNVYTWIPFIN